MKLTDKQLGLILEGYNFTDLRLKEISSSLNKAFDKYEINTRLRQCHFLGQLLHESGCFKYKEENLYYSAKRLMVVFKKYFTDIETAKEYEKRPEKIANYVYGNRMGNVHAKDGYKFRGRTSIMLTGYNNYKEASKEFDQDFMSNPDMINEIPYYYLIPAWFWHRRGLNKYADADNVNMVTKRINGGLNGLSDRIKWTDKCKIIIKNT